MREDTINDTPWCNFCTSYGYFINSSIWSANHGEIDEPFPPEVFVDHKCCIYQSLELKIKAVECLYSRSQPWRIHVNNT